MSFATARPKARGFTLIELLIVVIILAILAAIAIPQFSASTVDARNAALDANLATIRGAIEQYRVQHNNVSPGVATAVSTACPSGNPTGTGGANSAQALISQLSMASNAAGETCTVATADFRFGPYLRGGMPNEPINNRGAQADQIAITNNIGAIAPAAATVGGWAFNTATGQFIMNSTGDDGNGRTYAVH